ncbi:MAG: hypothetical protein HY665_00290 [Chloroflexi bacterium]|nr:hypothetical protein [Chloroflexota bacterium]
MVKLVIKAILSNRRGDAAPLVAVGIRPMNAHTVQIANLTTNNELSEGMVELIVALPPVAAAGKPA